MRNTLAQIQRRNHEIRFVDKADLSRIVALHNKLAINVDHHVIRIVSYDLMIDSVVAGSNLAIVSSSPAIIRDTFFSTYMLRFNNGSLRTSFSDQKDTKTFPRLHVRLRCFHCLIAIHRNCSIFGVIAQWTKVKFNCASWDNSEMDLRKKSTRCAIRNKRWRS